MMMMMMIKKTETMKCIADINTHLVSELSRTKQWKDKPSDQEKKMREM